MGNAPENLGDQRARDDVSRAARDLADIAPEPAPERWVTAQ
jgi:hypothetical protein